MTLWSCHFQLLLSYHLPLVNLKKYVTLSIYHFNSYWVEGETSGKNSSYGELTFPLENMDRNNTLCRLLSLSFESCFSLWFCRGLQFRLHSLIRSVKNSRYWYYWASLVTLHSRVRLFSFRTMFISSLNIGCATKKFHSLEWIFSSPIDF